MGITKKFFDKLSDGREVYTYTLKNANGMKAKICEFGAAIVKLVTPDKNGTFSDVVCGYDSMYGYENGDGYQGAVVGRWGNRIAKGRFTLDGVEYQLSLNNGNIHLHAGALPSAVLQYAVSGSTGGAGRGSDGNIQSLRNIP